MQVAGAWKALKKRYIAVTASAFAPWPRDYDLSWMAPVVSNHCFQRLQAAREDLCWLRHDRHSVISHYDHLVLALGSVTNFFNLPGLTELALAMKSLPDAIQLRAQIIGRLEEANSQCVFADRQALLTFVVAGGGFAGVETVAAMNDFVREALRFYPNLRKEMLRVVLVHSRAEILPELGESLGRYAQEALGRRGVEICLNTRVTSMTEKEIFLTGGTPIPASTLVWTAGTVPNPLVSSLPCAKESARVLVNEFLEVPGWPGVWAVGDCGFVPDARQPGKSHPPTAQHAIREGRVVAHNIATSLYRRPLKPFSFRTIGRLASIGRRRGVARIFGFNFSGFFAWWLWRTIYLSKLPGLDKKIRVAFEWTLDLLFRKDVCAVHRPQRRSDCYHEEHRKITLAATATAGQQSAPTPAVALTNSYDQKKENVREYPAPVSGQEQWPAEPYKGIRCANA